MSWPTAALLAMMNWDQISGNASDQLLSATSLLTMMAVYPGVKLLHELSHAYAARRFGAEVHDMGLMFLILMPVPYVDASAASGLTQRSHRVVVSAVGIMVELLLAALALYLWTAIQPGLVRDIAFVTLLTAGLSTLAVNANPLLRFAPAPK